MPQNEKYFIELFDMTDSPKKMEGKKDEPIEKNVKDRVIFVTDPFPYSFEGYEIVKRYFKTENVIWAVWDKKKDPKKEFSKKIDSYEYEYMISFWNDYIIKERQFKKASKGAINFHPSCLEHPGLGFWSFPVLFPEKRSHHGSCMHEIDKKIDHGVIYRHSKWPCNNLRPEDLAYCNASETLEWLEDACKIMRNGDPTSELMRESAKGAKWGEHYFSHKEENEWFKKLPKGHIGLEYELYRAIDLMEEKYYKGYKYYKKWLIPEFKMKKVEETEDGVE